MLMCCTAQARSRCASRVDANVAHVADIKKATLPRHRLVLRDQTSVDGYSQACPSAKN